MKSNYPNTKMIRKYYFLRTFGISILLLFLLPLSACFSTQPTNLGQTQRAKKSKVVPPPVITKKQFSDDRGYIVKVGDKAPKLAMDLANGASVKSKDWKGKVVVLQFTASWCGVCRKEMPVIEQELWKPYKDKGLVVIGVDRDEPLEKVQEFAKQMKITYPLALDPGAEIFSKFAIKQSGVTRNVVIDQKGNIVCLTRLFDREEFDKMKEIVVDLLEQ